MAVLHSRDNRIPEAHQSIQKLFTQMNVLQSYPKTELPLSVLELLIHYNLRTQNLSAALQLIKRRRIIGSGVIKPVLNITKWVLSQWFWPNSHCFVHHHYYIWYHFVYNTQRLTNNFFFQQIRIQLLKIKKNIQKIKEHRFCWLNWNMNINCQNQEFLFFLFYSCFFSRKWTRNSIGSAGVSLQISRSPSVISGITLSIKYCRIGLDFSFKISRSCWVSF